MIDKNCERNFYFSTFFYKKNNSIVVGKCSYHMHIVDKDFTKILRVRVCVCVLKKCVIYYFFNFFLKKGHCLYTMKYEYFGDANRIMCVIIKYIHMI